MDPGDLVYFLLIIFGIVVSVISNINKAKKNRPKTTTAAPQQPAEPEYEEAEREVDVKSIFEEIIGQAQQQQQAPPPPVAEPVSSVEELEKEPFSRDSIEDLSEEELRKEHFHMDEPEIYDESETNGKPQGYFDLKQAIIYDAIMNRPYS